MRRVLVATVSVLLVAGCGKNDCEKAGGACVFHGMCIGGTVGDPSQYACSNAGGNYDCCLSADGGS